MQTGLDVINHGHRNTIEVHHQVIPTQNPISPARFYSETLAELDVFALLRIPGADAVIVGIVSDVVHLLGIGVVRPVHDRDHTEIVQAISCFDGLQGFGHGGADFKRAFLGPHFAALIVFMANLPRVFQAF